MAVGCMKIAVGESFLVAACVTLAAGCRIFLKFGPFYLHLKSQCFTFFIALHFFIFSLRRPPCLVCAVRHVQFAPSAMFSSRRPPCLVCAVRHVQFAPSAMFTCEAVEIKSCSKFLTNFYPTLAELYDSFCWYISEQNCCSLKTCT
jgi:hypothetical protein